MKKPVTTHQKEGNKALNRARVLVECYFGRLYRKFSVFGHIYRYDHQNVDIDFENACWLINEDVMVSELSVDDGDYYQKCLDARVEHWHANETKRKANYEKYKKNKRTKLAKVQKYVGK